MNVKKQSILNFTVSNVQILEAGLTAQKSWDLNGGIIGSSSSSDWILKDSAGKTKPFHCEVVLVDGVFCIKDLSGETYINGSHMPLGQGELARLDHKDEIHIGPYVIRVLREDSDDAMSHASLATLLNTDSNALIADEKEEDNLQPALDESEESLHIDPLAALDEVLPKENEFSLIDELEKPKVDEESQRVLIPENNLALQQPDFTPQADSDFEISSSVRLKKMFKKLWSGSRHSENKSTPEETPANKQLVSNSTDNNVLEGLEMDERVLDLLEEEVAKSVKPEQVELQSNHVGGTHLLTGPMLNGMGVDISYEHDMERMHALSRELGESLQACVKGLLDVHAQVQEGRFGVMNRNLQPIEDNPLRLGLSYEETMRTLYDGEQSLVHLSAPAAISESLKNVRAHNEAMQHATTEALCQILNAFSPDVLTRRFQNYKRSSDNVNQSEGEWAWNMYQNYYQELTSNRQRGFEKLFWEIFEQAYDKKIREKQLEF